MKTWRDNIHFFLCTHFCPIANPAPRCWGYTYTYIYIYIYMQCIYMWGSPPIYIYNIISYYIILHYIPSTGVLDWRLNSSACIKRNEYHQFMFSLFSKISSSFSIFWYFAHFLKLVFPHTFLILGSKRVTSFSSPPTLRICF